jgi:hypothetical protein
MALQLLSQPPGSSKLGELGLANAWHTSRIEDGKVTSRPCGQELASRDKIKMIKAREATYTVIVIAAAASAKDLCEISCDLGRDL